MAGLYGTVAPFETRAAPTGAGLVVMLLDAVAEGARAGADVSSRLTYATR